MTETQEKAIHSLDDEDSLDEDSYSDEELSNENNDVLEEDLDNNNPSSSSNIPEKSALYTLAESAGLDLLKTETVKTVCAIAVILGIVGFLTVDSRLFVITLIGMAIYVLDEAISGLNFKNLTAKVSGKNNKTTTESEAPSHVEDDELN